MYNVIYYFEDGISNHVKTNGEILQGDKTVLYNAGNTTGCTMLRKDVIQIVPITCIGGYWIHSHILMSPNYIDILSTEYFTEFILTTFTVDGLTIRLHKFVMLDGSVNYYVIPL